MRRKNKIHVGVRNVKCTKLLKYTFPSAYKIEFPAVVHLLSAFAASAAAAIAGIPIFVPELNKLLSIAGYTWAPVWAMTILELDIRVTFSAAAKSIVGAWFGVGTACLSFYLSTLVFEDDLYKQHAMALVFMMPFTTLTRYSYPDTQSYLVHILRWDVGLICGYAVAGFGRDITYWTATSIGLGFTIGAVAACLLALLNRALRPGARKARVIGRLISQFRVSHSVWFEALVDCVGDSTKSHHEELERRQNEANDAFRDLQALIRSIKTDFVNQLNDVSTLNALDRAAATVNICLFAIRGALSQNSHTSRSVQRILTPELRLIIQETKLAMAITLRPDGHVVTSTFKPIVLASVSSTSSTTSTNRQADDSVQDDDDDDFVTRFLFIITCLNEFQESIRNFVTIVDKLESSQTSFVSRLKSVSSYTLKTLVTVPSANKSSYPFLIKGLLANEILAQSLLALQYQFRQYEISDYFGWAVVGYIVTYLPTCGEAIVRGSRRAVGTLSGSAITAIIAVAGTIDNLSAFFIMITIIFVGKLASYHPFISYAGIVFALCQLFEFLPQMEYVNGKLSVSEGSDLLFVVLYRTICMCIGVGFSMVCSILIYPNYSSNIAREIFSKSLITISQVIGDRFSAANTITTTTTNNSHGFVESDLADLGRIFSIQKKLPEACAKGKSELFILSRRHTNKAPFRLSNILKSEGALYRFSNTAFIVCLIVAFSKKSDHQIGHLPETVNDLFHELLAEFHRCIHILANMIQHPSTSALPRECVFAWSLKVGQIYDTIQDTDSTSSSSSSLNEFRNILFALTEFFTAYDHLLKSLDPQLKFTSSRALSGIRSGRSVRLSIN